MKVRTGKQVRQIEIGGTQLWRSRICLAGLVPPAGHPANRRKDPPLAALAASNSTPSPARPALAGGLFN